MRLEIKIKMIDTNITGHNYTYYINLLKAIFGHQKFLITLRELPTAAVSCNVKIKENLPLVGII